jgi:hypothetical protein
MGMVNSLDSLDLFPGKHAIEGSDLCGNLVARQSRLNPLFQIEKNFLKEEIDRGWEERPSRCPISRITGQVPLAEVPLVRLVR